MHGFGLNKDNHCQPFYGFLFGQNLDLTEKLSKVKKVLHLVDKFENIVIEFTEKSDEWVT